MSKHTGISDLFKLKIKITPPKSWDDLKFDNTLPVRDNLIPMGSIYGESSDAVGDALNRVCAT